MSAPKLEEGDAMPEWEIREVEIRPGQLARIKVPKESGAPRARSRARRAPEPEPEPAGDTDDGADAEDATPRRRRGRPRKSTSEG